MYKTNQEILQALSSEAVLEWLASDQNEIDWALANVDLSAVEDNDAEKEALYHLVRARFISVLVQGRELDDLPFASLAILRVDVKELAAYIQMDEEEKVYVDAMLENGVAPTPTFTYKATGRKAMVVGLVTGAVLGLAAVALIARLRK